MADDDAPRHRATPPPMPEAPLPAGKLPAELLAALLPRCRDPRVLQGPGVGRDAAVVEVGDRLWVLASDPITFASEALAHYAVTVNANDIAVTGATPRWLLATVLLPVGDARPAQARALLQGLEASCREAGVELVGGHTEVSDAVNRAVVVGSMIGEVSREAWVPSDGARPGDALLCTGGVPIEGLALLASEAAPALRKAGVSAAEIRGCARLLEDPGISVGEAARLAAGAARVHAMHDPTEGGLATAVHEMADAAGVGVVVDEAAIPWLPQAARLCGALGLDPLGLIASGALLVALAEEDLPEVGAALDQAGICHARIGHCLEDASQRRLRDAAGAERELPRFDADEITRL